MAQKLLSRFWIWVPGLAVCFFAGFYWSTLAEKASFGYDDAYITFKFGKNLLAGQGFVYNPGGERVEGSTSLLWTILTAPFFAFMQRPEHLLMLLSTLLTAMAAVLAARMIRDASNGALPFSGMKIFIFILILAATPAFIQWNCIRLLETPLWTLELVLLAGVSVRCLRDNKGHMLLGLVLLATLVTRPESTLIGTAILAALFFVKWKQESALRPAVKFILLPALFFISGFAALTVFRILYFGYPFPNTYYAKVGDDFLYTLLDGARYVAHFMVDFPSNAILLLSSAGVLIVSTLNLFSGRGMESRFYFSFFASVIVAAETLAVLLTGADHFDGFRFFSVVLPLMAVCVLADSTLWQWKILSQISNRFPGTARVSLSLYALILLGLGYHHFKTADYHFGYWLPGYKMENGKTLNTLFGSMDPLPSYAEASAGAIAMTYKGPFLDMMALTSVKMAHASRNRKGMKDHAAFDVAAFYEMAPDILEAFPATSFADTLIPEQGKGKRQFAITIYKEIFFQDAFRKEYVPGIVSNAEGTLFLQAYYKRSFLERIKERGMHFSRILRDGEVPDSSLITF